MTDIQQKIRPLQDRVVVRSNESTKKTEGGIIIPDSAKEKPSEGEVVALGTGKIVEGKLQPLQVKVGDKVLFGKYAGTNIKLNDNDYLIMREEDIMCVLED